MGGEKSENTIEDSRTPFIKEVARTILEHHGKESESFIFGISGKWGEGKTHFLNGLRDYLKEVDPSFEVFDINPWKFSTDRISFLRNFLITLYKKAYLDYESKLRVLDVDTSESDVHWGHLVKFTALLALGCLVFGYTLLFGYILSLMVEMC